MRDAPPRNVLSSQSTTEWQALNEFGPHVASSVSPLDTGHWQDVWLLVGITKSTPIHCFLYSWKFIVPLFHSCYPHVVPRAVLSVPVAVLGVEQENQGATFMLEPRSAKYQQLCRVILILTSLSFSSPREIPLLIVAFHHEVLTKLVLTSKNVNSWICMDSTINLVALFICLS